MAKIHENIAAALDRADEISADLLKEYDRCLGAKEVGARAKQLTHDVCIQLRSALDRVARRYWEKYVAPSMTKERCGCIRQLGKLTFCLPKVRSVVSA